MDKRRHIAPYPIPMFLHLIYIYTRTRARKAYLIRHQTPTLLAVGTYSHIVPRVLKWFIESTREFC